MIDVLRQIGRTALLCAALGLALYLVLARLVEYELFVPIAVLILAGGFSILLAYELIGAWQSGEFPSKGKPIRRDSEPVCYWAFLILESACAVCLIIMALLSLSRLIVEFATAL